MISAFVVSYGYFAVFAGTLLEGETILIAAGFAAHNGLLDWPIVVLVAIAGGTLGDQLAFLLGRWKGEALIERFPALSRHKPRIDDLLARYDAIFILAVRFLYGLRIVGPVILGSGRVPFLRFAVFNVMGATLWAILVSGAGYFLGLAMNTLIADLKSMEEILLLAILALGGSVWLLRRLRAKKRNKKSIEERRL